MLLALLELLLRCCYLVSALRNHLSSSVLKQWRFWKCRDEAPGPPYNYDFLAGLYIFCCNLHNMEQRYTESL